MKKNIFIVTDKNSDLALTATSLELRYWIMPITSAEKMFSLLWRMTPDLIFLDFEMSELDGFDVLRKIKEDPIWVKIPLVLLTKQEDNAFRAKALKAGALDVLYKPVIPSVLFDCVMRYAF